ncbi:MAG: hypothetical protein U0694_13220 [Anaerolineae bacterium]
MLENRVVVSSLAAATWRGAKPMNDLLTAMGATTMFDGENERCWI